MKASLIWSWLLELISEDLTSSRVVWDCSLNYCGVRPHRKLNIRKETDSEKVLEGKVKRTLKRESKELEIVKREAKSSKFKLLRSGRMDKTVYLLLERPYSGFEMN